MVKAGKLLGVDSTLRTDNNSGVKIIPSEAEVLKLEARYEAVTADFPGIKRVRIRRRKGPDPLPQIFQENYGN